VIPKARRPRGLMLEVESLMEISFAKLDGRESLSVFLSEMKTDWVSISRRLESFWCGGEQSLLSGERSSAIRRRNKN